MATANHMAMSRTSDEFTIRRIAVQAIVVATTIEVACFACFFLGDLPDEGHPGDTIGQIAMWTHLPGFMLAMGLADASPPPVVAGIIFIGVNWLALFFLSAFAISCGFAIRYRPKMLPPADER